MKIFITRTLSQDSLLKSLLPPGHQLFGESLIKISTLPLLTIPRSDWIFFYSKTGIERFFSQLPDNEIHNISSRKFGVMGNGSDTCLMKHIHKSADFIAGGNLEESVERFHQETIQQEVLFVKAKNSRSTFEQEENVLHKPLVIYENSPKSSISPIEADVVIFTSPMNVKAFFSSNEHDSGTTYIAIGSTTAEALSGIDPEIKYIRSKGHSEQDLADTLTELFAPN
ncbi:MAG: uroporphyrinogen-III synthase [Saprospiraceae bacterium]|nr:uroporphyrinogen-III synthase [Saprospiraceae bacterium]